MGVFSRFKDIISSNINAMLDKAEDPEKMIRLMIQEMEETLVEIKSSCARIMADKKKSERELHLLGTEMQRWQQRAELAVAKNRDELAREALIEKKRYEQRMESTQHDIGHYEAMIKQAHDDIIQLEDKINTARTKQQILLKRHLRAGQKLKTQKEIRRAGSAQALQRFEEFEQKIDRIEAEAGLVNPSITPEFEKLEDEFVQLENEDSIAEELQELKRKASSDT